MIDTHIHAVKSRVPGSKNPATLLDGSPAAVAAVIKDQMSGSGVEVVLGMGHLGGADGDPLGIASTLKVAELLPELHAIGVADPTR
ncbi:MAG: amidohydrolase, partial [Syntrophobacteraceae bacterium]